MYTPEPNTRRIERRIAVGIGQLHVVAGVGLVDRQDLQHVAVVFLQQAADACRVPVLGRRADGIETRRGGVQRRGRVHVGRRIPPLELRHFDHLAAVRFGQAQYLVIANEAANALDRRPGVTDQVLRPAVFLLDRLADQADRRAMSGRVVRRQGRERIIAAPELPCGEIEFALDADEIGLGGGQHLIGRQAGIELQRKLLGELRLAQPPGAVGPRADHFFQELLVVFEADGDLFRGLLESVFLRRLTGQFEDILFIEIDRAPVLHDGRFQHRAGRLGDRLPCGRHNPRDVLHACDGMGQVGLLGQCRLGQQDVNAAVDVVGVRAGIFLEGPRVLVQPEGLFEIVPEDLEIDLARPRKLGVIDLAARSAKARRVRSIHFARDGAERSSSWASKRWSPKAVASEGCCWKYSSR